MRNKVDIESAIINMKEVNTLVQFIDSHAYDLQSLDEALSIIHTMAGLLSHNIDALDSAFYAAKPGVN